MLFERTGSTLFDHIKYIDNNYAKRDCFLKMVISTFQSTEWKNMYGLSITETMKLEYADYFLMADELKRHTAVVKSNTDVVTSQILNDN